jgi:uncharacterized protein (TIGR00251 family)
VHLVRDAGPGRAEGTEPGSAGDVEDPGCGPDVAERRAQLSHQVDTEPRPVLDEEPIVVGVRFAIVDERVQLLRVHRRDTRVAGVGPLGTVPTGVRLAVRAKPKATRDAIGAIRGDELEVSVRAAPEGGRANDAIRAVLAAAFEVPPSAVRLVAGASSRHKRFEIDGITRDEARSRLGLLL